MAIAPTLAKVSWVVMAAATIAVLVLALLGSDCTSNKDLMVSDTLKWWIVGLSIAILLTGLFMAGTVWGVSIPMMR